MGLSEHIGYGVGTDFVGHCDFLQLFGGEQGSSNGVEL